MKSFRQTHIIIALICLAVVMLSANLLFGQTDDAATPLDFPTWFVTGVGLLIPLATQWIVKNLTTSTKKFWGSLTLQVLCGTAGAFVLGFTWNNLPELLTAIFALSQLSYRLWWKAIFEKTLAGEALGLSPSSL